MILILKNYFFTHRYFKFVHNVALNALASIYFHNYLRFDEMPPQSQQNDEEKLADGVDTTSTSTKHPDKFVDSQRPGSIGFEPFSIT